MSTPEPRPARRGYFLPGLIALAVLVLIGLAFGAGDLEHPTAKNLSGADIAGQIALGIQSEQNDRTVPSVSCPSESVHPGLVFQCTDRSARPARTVYVTETDDRGDVRWSFDPPATPST